MAQFPDEQDESGSFKRQEDEFRDWVDSTEVEPGRYHLYVCKACPWAHRSWIVLRLMGLEDSVTVSFVDPIRDEKGWAFREGNGHGPDTAEGFEYLSEAYRANNPNYNNRVTVPVLWDKKAKRLINNSEDDICKMFVSQFKELAKHPVDLFPQSIEAEQKELSDLIYESVNNGVYRAGFATSQSSYEEAYLTLFETLDSLENWLGNGGPFLFGDQIVESDWRLFCTLIRFDPVYHGHFKCNKRRITEYPNLQEYMERLYFTPGIAETVNFDHIKRHYYVTHDDINPTQVVPMGPEMDWLKKSR